MGALVGIGLLFLLAQSVLRHFATLLAMILVAGIAVPSAVCLPRANPHDIFGTFGYQDVNLGFAVFSLVILAPWAFVGFEVVTLIIFCKASSNPSSTGSAAKSTRHSRPSSGKRPRMT